MESADEELRQALGIALREVRLRNHLSILELSQRVSGRSYLGAVERAEKLPTVGKVDEISRSMGMHPLALLTLAYLRIEQNTPEEMMARIKSDLEAIELWGPWGFGSEAVASDSED
ncbi:XRE family transcriptional regulator [Pseudomonas sp. NPDC088368]|uniref:XRE family transcriptional regulator n=1 Tax=Pseudomonas sp. NPDC088368 TaxID=3364453 RepID=UPI00381ECFAC